MLLQLPMNYLIGLQIKKSSLSFTFATQQIKKLLTSRGRILEIYVYHKLRETRGFDAAVCSFEVEWEVQGKGIILLFKSKST